MKRKWMMACTSTLALIASPALAKDWKARLAEKGVAVEAAYTIDFVSTSGGVESDSYHLDNFDLIVDVDMEQMMGWKGGQIHAYFIANNGQAPNDGAGTLEGIDNIETGLHRGKLYEFWVQQSFEWGEDKSFSILGGLYDVNSEFYATGTADAFIHPAFGIGSELAATGINGPSIFASTGLALRAKYTHGDYYGQVVAVNADARTWGDPDGIDTSFDNGVLVVGEAGIDGDRKIAIGAWAYTDDFANVYDSTPAESHGIYALFDTPVWSNDDVAVRGDLPPGRPSFITRVLGVDSCWFRVGQARRARSPHIAQALVALLLGSCCQARNGA